MQKYYTYVLYLLLSILVVTLYLNDFSPIASAQLTINDTIMRLTASEETPPNIALVRIDGRSFDEYGNWPWNRDLVADLTAAVASANPKVIVLNLNLMENAIQNDSGYNAILAEQFGWIKNMVIPYDVSLATYQNRKTSNPPYLFNYSVGVKNPLGVMKQDASLQVRKIFLPAAKLLDAEPFLGFDYNEPDPDGILRHQPLLMNYEGYYYPSVGLLAASRYLNLPVDQILAGENGTIELGSDVTLPVGRRSNFFINFSAERPFATYSAVNVLAEGFDFSRLAGKVVLIGLDDLNASEYFESALNEQVVSLTIQASIIDNIINDNIIKENPISAGIDLLILFALGGICAFLLPRVTLSHRFMILSGLLVVTANLTFFMLSSFSILTHTIYFAFEILIFMAAAPILDSELITGEIRATKSGRIKVPKARTQIIAGDSGDIPVRELKESANDPASEDTKAVSVDESGPMDHQAINFDDQNSNKTTAAETVSSGKIESSEGADESDELVISSGRGDSPDRVVTHESKGEPPKSTTKSRQNFVMPTNAADIKNLGRYQIKDVLGQGAMGLVYKGIDPAINRLVALKTIRLDFVNDPAEMEDLKERLFREAQAAGKLSHPNIVTIYDVGSEGPLQYIAMEHLKGQTLEEMIAKKTKFNYRIISQIIVQICSALEYAHDMGIIHRDIKPANLMVMEDYQIKVMDYGIAKIDSHSMTKTGIAMGTPNYISPEQLKGLKPDRRGDIFSLGVVMYEMLLGRRPFKGENITTLIYAILNTEPEKPSTINPQIPMIFDRILEKALAKNPDDRFQKASEVAEALEDFVESFSAR